MSFLRVASVGLFVFAAGCALDQVEESAEVQAIAGGPCGLWSCGTNSPEIDHLGVHDFHGQVGGQKNANGFYVTKIERTTCTTPPGPTVCTTKQYDRVSTTAGLLTASGPNGSLSGANVKGLTIRFANANTGAKYVLSVASVGSVVRLWSKNPTYLGLENWPQYEIKWDVERPPGYAMAWKAVCTNPPGDGSPDLLGMNRFHTVLFENDEIDAPRKLVKGTRPSLNWINLGCAGHALAKMVLTGNVSATITAFGYRASFDDMTAALKLWAADYLGDGTSWTVAGTPLGIYNTKNNYGPGTFKKEALWTHKGAACLNTPRVLASPTPLAVTTFPALEADLIAANGGTRPPFCPDADPYALNGRFILSSNKL
jgi:ADYC domain